MNIKDKYGQYMEKMATQRGLLEVNGETREHTSLMQVKGKQVSGSADHQTVLYARGGETALGYAVSQCQEDPPEALLEQAVENSRYLPETEIVSQQECKSFEEPLEPTAVEALRKTAETLEKALSQKIGSISVKETIRTQWVVNQKGLNRQYSRRRFEAAVYGKTRSYITTAQKLEDLTADRLLPDVKEDEKNQLPEGSCRAGVYRAVISPYVMAKFWVTGWQLFSGRQYAAGTGALFGQLHQKAAAEGVTIQDLPATPGSGFQFPFDCEGSDGKAVDLIRNGRMEGLMHNLASARALQTESTGNGGRIEGLVKGTDIVVTPKNFVFQPGEWDLESLLDTMGDGLYIVDAWDEFHAINTASGEFSFPCSAVVVRNGHRESLVKGMTMNGNIRDLLMNVEKVGNRLCYIPQLMHDTYMVAAPAVLVSGLSVSGCA